MGLVPGAPSRFISGQDRGPQASLKSDPLAVAHHRPRVPSKRDCRKPAKSFGNDLQPTSRFTTRQIKMVLVKTETPSENDKPGENHLDKLGVSHVAHAVCVHFDG